MYHRNDLQVSTSKHGCPSFDAREEDGYNEGLHNPPCVSLPHSCDEWIIGGPDQIRDLITDLQAVLAKMGP